MTIPQAKIRTLLPVTEEEWDQARNTLNNNFDLIREHFNKISNFAPSDLNVVEPIRKTANEIVNNSTSLQDDDELLVALAANETLYFEAMVIVSDTSNTPDIKLAFTVPSGATLRWSGVSTRPANASVVKSSGTPISFIIDQNAAVFVRGIVRNGGNTGDLQLQWAQNNANASDTTVEADSYLKLIRE